MRNTEKSIPPEWLAILATEHYTRNNYDKIRWKLSEQDFKKLKKIYAKTSGSLDILSTDWQKNKRDKFINTTKLCKVFEWAGANHTTDGDNHIFTTARGTEYRIPINTKTYIYGTEPSSQIFAQDLKRHLKEEMDRHYRG